jgi:hypothetical protein
VAKPPTARAAPAAAPAIKRKPDDKLEGPERKTQRRDIEGNKGDSEAGGASKPTSKPPSETNNVKPVAKEEIRAKPTVGPCLPSVAKS